MQNVCKNDDMGKDRVDKTNAMRILDGAGAKYEVFSLGISEAVSGVEAARILGVDEAQVFKTLVTVGKSLEHYVFVIPVAKELDLKLAAQAVSEKNVEMLKSKDLFPLTGYVHGGCSPLGMKKSFVTVIDDSALRVDKLYFSAGKIGVQICSTLEQLRRALKFSVAPVTR